MNEAKRKRLAAAGYQSTTVADFLGLSAEQSELIEIKILLTSALKRQRVKRNVSQSQLAEQIGSSQSRVAKMEAGDPHVSLDLMIRTLLATGMTRGALAEVIAGRQPHSTDPEGQAALPSTNGAFRNEATRKQARKPQAAA